MEVHHHGHGDHGKKSWRSYFWEFVMLFLAVFCGSLAEYKLEHKIEHDREEQYILSMIEDLKEDTTKMSLNIPDKEIRIAALDSLMENIYSDIRTDSSLRALYYFVRKYAGARNDVTFTKRTIEQLKHAGGLRLIRNSDASDSIIMYSEASDICERQSESIGNAQRQMMDLSVQLFDLEYLKDYDRGNINTLLADPRKPWLLNDDPKLFKEYANRVYYFKAMTSVYRNLMISHKKRAASILEMLKSSYHVEG
jgi:hypothetical protein